MLREQIASDIKAVFLNLHEMADTVTFGGLPVQAIKDEIPAQESKIGEGANERALSIFCAEADIPILPKNGSSVEVDGEPWRVGFVRRDAGIVNIKLYDTRVNPDALTEAVSVLRPVAGERNEIGGEDEEGLSPVTALWAIVRAVSSQDRTIAMQGAELRTHEARVQIPDDAGEETLPVQYGDILEWRGTRLVVKGLRPDWRARLLIADCVYINA